MFFCSFRIYFKLSSFFGGALGRSHGSRQRGTPWIFVHDTDKAEGGLMVLFFGLVFYRRPLLEIFLPMPLDAGYLIATVLALVNNRV